jgi:Rha family phage regulatory protein
MPFAQKFERWIFEEVLPSIRKTGDYKLPQSSASSLKLTINNVEVELIAKEDQVWATSLDIAKAFEKRHDNVIRDIRALPEDSFYLLNFGEVEYQHINPRSGGIVKYPMFRVSKDGFMMLAMGFTGQGSHQWKIAFIEGFNRLERMVMESRWVKADWRQRQGERFGSYSFAEGLSSPEQIASLLSDGMKYRKLALDGMQGHKELKRRFNVLANFAANAVKEIERIEGFEALEGKSEGVGANDVAPSFFNGYPKANNA